MRLRCNSAREQRPIMNTKYVERAEAGNQLGVWEAARQFGSLYRASQCTAQPKLQNNWCTGQPACGSPYTDRVINIQYCNVRITLFIIAFFEVNSISCFVSQRDERKNIPVQVHASLYSNIQQHSYLRWERVNELHWLTDWLTDWLRCVMTTAACNLFKKIRRKTRKTNSRNWIMNETNAFTFRRGFSSFWN